MDSNLKQLLSELNVNDDDRTRLGLAGVCTLVELATFDHEAHFHKDSQLTEHIKKLNENQLIIICSPDPLLHAREILGLPTTTTETVRFDTLPTSLSQHFSEDRNLQGSPLNESKPALQVKQEQRNEVNINNSHIGELNHESEVKHYHDNRKVTNNNFSGATFNFTGAQNVTVHLGSETVVHHITDEEIEIFRKRRQNIKEGMFEDKGELYPTSSLHLQNGENWFIDQIEAEGYSIEMLKRLPKNDYYPIKTKPRALLLNNFRFSNGLSNRRGAESDSIKLAALLKQLGFHVEVQENQKAVEIKQIFQEFIKNCKDASMVLVFIGSHGGGVNNGDMFLDSDNEPVYFESVLNCFNETNFPELKGKPKIFFTQFCRMEVSSSSWKYRSSALPVPINGRGHDFKDMLIVHSTMPGCVSFRDTEDGTWFVSAFIKVAEENAKREHLGDMLLKVNKIVANKNANGKTKHVQICHIESTLTDKIYFVKSEAE